MSIRQLALPTVCFLMASSICFPDERPWHEIRSPHFRIVTNGSEAAGRHVARQFELMRTVFASQFPTYRLDGAEPIVIIAPEDEPTARKLLPEYWKHSGPKPAGVYFHAWEQPYVLVRLDTLGDQYSADEFAVVYHEYIHSLLHLNLHWLPTWLDEGLAEFYAYTRFEGERTYIGAPPRDMGRLSLLRYRSPMPLEKFLEQHGSFTHNEEDTQLFYAQCWAFTHYLVMAPGLEVGGRLNKFMHAIEQGVPQKKAFQDTFGDLNQVQKDFDQYIHRFAFQAGVIPTPAKIEDKDLVARSLSVAETEAELSSFYAATHQWELARQEAESAIKSDPKLALAHQEMGFVLLQEGKDEDATREFSKAIDLDNKMYRALFAKTMLSPLPHSSNPDDRQALRLELLKVLQVNAQFAPAYVELAKLNLAQGDAKNALALALKAERLEPWRAGYHLLTGNILLRVNRDRDAAFYAVYVADHWFGPDHDEAIELWNLIPASDRSAQGPMNVSFGADVITAEGIVKSVACSEHGMTITLDKSGQAQTFHVQIGAMGGFSDTLWFGEDHYTPCYHTAGLRGVLRYKPASDKAFTGEVVSYGFRDDLPAAPATSATAANAGTANATPAK
jgi:tetratricopeptide (TPR) repeat protein